MKKQTLTLSPPSLEELAKSLSAPLAANYQHSSVTVTPCPDLRKSPFFLATEGLSGDERIADVGGQPNLFPTPRLDNTWSLAEIARNMDLDPEQGSLIGAGAGPFHKVGRNCELAPNVSWRGDMEEMDNQTRVVQIIPETGAVSTVKSPSPDCALMINLYGCKGSPGPVLKITARRRTGNDKSFTECIRQALIAAYGEERPISLGGVFVVKSGRARYHVMPDFPAKEKLPFKDRKAVDDWLTFHDFDAPMVCMTAMHTADPEGMGLRMEHTHSFSPLDKDAGGHYHYDVDGFDDDIEYEAYFNTAKMIYRLDRPSVA